MIRRQPPGVGAEVEVVTVPVSENSAGGGSQGVEQTHLIGGILRARENLGDNAANVSQMLDENRGSVPAPGTTLLVIDRWWLAALDKRLSQGYRRRTAQETCSRRAADFHL